MKNTITTNRALIHSFISALAMVVLVSWLYISVFEQSYPEKLVYHNAEIRSANLQDIRVADYAIRKVDDGFLVAQGAPKELDLRIEFFSAGEFTAVVAAEYPHWLCDPSSLNKAVVSIRGGTANERIKLIEHEPKEFLFSIAKGQKLRMTVQNATKEDCGRAITTFYRDNYKLAAKLWLGVFWALIFVLCIYAGISPYIATLGVLTNILLLTADASLGPLSISSVIVNTGMSMICLAGLLLFAMLPKLKISTVLVFGILAFLFALPLAFIAYSTVFSAPLSEEAIHGAMQSYDTQIFEFWQQFIGKKRTLYVAAVLLMLFCCLFHIGGVRPRLGLALQYFFVFLLTGLAIVVGRVHESAMTNLLMRSVIEYRWEIDAFKKVADRRTYVATEAQRAAVHENDTTVIVIGESVNKKFMSAYGYVKDTTPLLDRRVNAGESILYKNAYSNHTHSNPTMAGKSI